MENKSKPKMSEELLDKMADFVIHELGTNGIYGITYAFSKNTDRDCEDNFNRYAGIREEANACGYKNNSIFRISEVANGYIYDLDIRAAKKILMILLESSGSITGIENKVYDIIENKPEERREKDMRALAKHVIEQLDNGKNKIEVALYNRNSVPRIVFSAKTQAGNEVLMKYKAYSIRHWDIETVNEKYLMPLGARIKSILVGEILPTKTGVRCVLGIEKINKDNC